MTDYTSTHPAPSIELVVLDMAGTTINDGGAVYDALRDCVEALGVSVSDQALQEWMGTDKRTAIRALGADAVTSDDMVETVYADFTDRLKAAYAQNPPTPIDGVPATFTALREAGVKIALTTGFAHDVADSLLATIGWTPGAPESPIDAVVCADDVAAGRPAPYMIFHAMETTGVLSAQAVLAGGDTVVDVEAGSNAGVKYVTGVLTGQLLEEQFGNAPRTHILRSVNDIPQVIGLTQHVSV